MDNLDGRVAAILSEHDLAINLGSDQGVEVGDYVVVKKLVQVVDPETSEALGTVEVPILRLAVTSTQPKLSVATVNERQESGNDAFAAALFRSGLKKIVKVSSEQRSGINVLIERGAPISISKAQVEDS